jgi:hypothetical protein
MAALMTNCMAIVAAIITINLLAAPRHAVADEKPINASDIPTTRAIPQDNLAYPVLITINNSSTKQTEIASGFYLNTLSTSYL